jgi:pilus assembly protein CpaE
MRVVVGQEAAGGAEPVRQVLLGLGLECSATDVVPFTDLPVRLSQGPVDLVLLRIGTDRDAAFRAIQQAAGQTGAPVFAFGPVSDVGHVLQASRSGAREYLDESRLGDDLQAALDKLRQNSTVKRSQGLVVAVASATPGSGVSTVAANLAFTWADKNPQKVALLEMGQEAADLALSLDLQPVHTVADVAENWQRMDATLLRQSMAVHPDGVCVLAQKPETLLAGPIEVPAIRKTIILLRSMFDKAVLDLGHTLTEEHFEAMKLSDRVALVVRLDVPALRHARQLLKQLSRRGIPDDRIRLVANRYGQTGQLSWGKAEEALGSKFTNYLPDDCAKLNKALNSGRPVVRLAPFSSITRRFYKLAGQLNGQHG